MDDLISRSVAINLLNEAQVEYDEYYKGLGKAKTIIDNAPTISLQDIYQEGHYDGHLEGYTKAINEERPPVTPDMAQVLAYECGKNERPTGEWEDYSTTFYRCPECGYLLEKDCPQCRNKIVLPNCGADMRTGQWIPVSERLPEDRQRVLIWFEYYRYGDFNCMYQTYGFGYVCDGKWSPIINGETGWQDYNIFAWQPLPEPYQKGGVE